MAEGPGLPRASLVGNTQVASVRIVSESKGRAAVPASANAKNMSEGSNDSQLQPTMNREANASKSSCCHLVDPVGGEPCRFGV
jgi:hypothetical protein